MHPPRRLVVVLEREVYVYALQSLVLLRTLESPENAKAVVALTPCSEPCLLALPSSASQVWRLVLLLLLLIVTGGVKVVRVGLERSAVGHHQHTQRATDNLSLSAAAASCLHVKKIQCCADVQ